MKKSRIYNNWTPCFISMPLKKLLFQGTASALVIFAVTGCAAPQAHIQTEPAERVNTTVYFSPRHGQTPARQDRDHYECYLWAVEQTEYDPAQTALAPHQRITVSPASTAGIDIAAGTIGGAVIGSILAGPRRHGEGLVLGAIAGMIMGTASESAKQDQAAQLQQQLNRQKTHAYSRLEKQADSYRRAISACLEGRGYEVH